MHDTDSSIAEDPDILGYPFTDGFKTAARRHRLLYHQINDYSPDKTMPAIVDQQFP